VSVRSTAGHVALCAAVAAVVGAALVRLGPPGTDLAAHVYQRQLFLTHGFELWNNFWYAGRYSFVGYSLLYYPLAALVGIQLLGILSLACAAGAFAIVAEREWGDAARWPARVFAVVVAASVVSAAFPYMLGLALALCTLAALQSRRPALFALLGASTFAASPLAFLLLLVVLVAAATRSRRLVMAPALAIGVTCVAGAALWRAFPAGGRFPFSATELAFALVFCGAGMVFTWRVPRARLLFAIFAIYATACVLAYLIPSAIGENIARLRYVAIPVTLLTLSLRHWRPLLPALGAFALALSWNMAPLAYSVTRSADDPSADRAYWTPAVRFLRSKLGPSYRVEAVDTAGHWDAVYLAEAGIPIVRGWFRQNDFPQNELLYDQLGRGAYLRWLRGLGVRYVVLTTAPPDYSARAEARLLASGGSGLRPVFRTATTTIYAVPAPRPIVTGPAAAQVVALRTSSIAFRVARPGHYHVAIRYTPYWSGEGVCVEPTGDGMFDIATPRAGVVRLRFAVTRRVALATMAGAHRPCAAAP
jgi:hypothetical protein